MGLLSYLSWLSDISEDEKLKKADMIHLVETSMEGNSSQLYSIQGYDSHFINVNKGKGIVTYFKPRTFTHEQNFVAANMQITKFTSNEVDAINVYRSQDGNSLELLNRIIEMISEGIWAHWPAERLLTVSGPFLDR